MWSYARGREGVPLMREQGAGGRERGTNDVAPVGAPRGMPIRPRLTRPPRILIASDQNRALRADPSIGSSTPILMLVPGRPNREDHLPALRAGVWELVREPLDVAGLLGRLDRYVLVKVERDGVSRRDLVDDVTGLYST